MLLMLAEGTSVTDMESIVDYRTFVDISHNFEPWSSAIDETRSGNPLSSLPHYTNGKRRRGRIAAEVIIPPDLVTLSPNFHIIPKEKGVTSSNPVPLKTRRVGERCTLNLLRAQMSSCWSGVVVKRGQLKYRPRHLTMAQNYEVRLQKALV
ncbi:hypothetical protein TNCV_3403071 [Trichonephila clavipes]|nr:hypothetical protein TNCV_3403071 [Trichonephila clavipes]